MPVTLTTTYTATEHQPSSPLNARVGISPKGTVIVSGVGIGNVHSIRRNDFYNTFDTDDVYEDASQSDSNLIDPIIGFYYEEGATSTSLTLEIKGQLADSGWTTLFNHHNTFSLRRADASRYYTQSTNITKFIWVRRDAYYTYPEQVELRSFFEHEAFGGFSNIAVMSMSFANEEIITPEIKTIERRMQYSDEDVTESNFERTNLQPKFPGEATGFRWDLTNTRIYAKQLGNGGFLRSRPHPGLPDVGPIVKNVQSCRVYWPIDFPDNITATQFTCKGYIHGEVPPTTASYDNWKSKIVGKKVRSIDGSFRATITDASFAVSTIEALALDLDANGTIDALTDGLMFLRYQFNLTGAALIDGAVATDAQRTTAAAIEAYLQDERVKQILDFDGNNSLDALTDGLMMLRYAFNLTGAALTDGAVASDSPFSLEEVAQRVEDAFQTMITLNNDYSVFDDGAPGGGDASAGATLTYTVDSGSLRDTPPVYANDSRGHTLYLEQAENTVPHSIRNEESTYSGASSFSFTWLSSVFPENANKIITARSFLNSHPMGIIEPLDTNTGAYSADLLPSVENRQHDFINNRARFVLQGKAGPTQEVVQGISSGDEGPTSTFDLSPYGQLVSWKINRHTDEIPLPSPYLIESQENCTVTVRQDNIQAIGGSLFLSVEPGFGGERYAARVRIRYGSGYYYYRLEGNVRGPHRNDSVSFNFPNANSGPLTDTAVVVSDYTPTLEGRDGLRLNFGLQTTIDKNEQESYMGQLVSVTPLIQNGGNLVTLAGPLKKARNEDTNITFRQDSTYFIPDGTSETWLCSGTFTVNFDNIARTFSFLVNGTWKKDFGIEVLNPDGGTRLNTNTSPLRYVARANGNAPRTAAEELSQVTVGSDFVPSGGSRTGWFHYVVITPTGQFTTRTDNAIQVWWQGDLITTHTFVGDPEDSVLYRVDFDTGDKYNRGSFEEGFGNHKFYNVTKTTSKRAEYYIYGDAPITLNGDNSPDQDFLVFNNQEQSQVGVQKEAGAYDLSPSNWLKQNGTRHNGEQDFYLNHKYSLQIVKVN